MFAQQSQKSGDTLSAADLLDMRQRLDDALKEIRIAYAAANMSSEAGDLEELQQSVSTLRHQLLEESSEASRNTLFVQRFQLGQALCDNMFSGDADFVDNVFVKRCLEEVEVTSQLMRILDETTELERQTQSQRLENIRVKKENTELMQQLRNQQKEKVAVSADAAKNKEFNRLKTELENREMMLKISKHLGQQLVAQLDDDIIMGEEMKDFLLKCGEHPHV